MRYVKCIIADNHMQLSYWIGLAFGALGTGGSGPGARSTLEELSIHAIAENFQRLVMR